VNIALWIGQVILSLVFGMGGFVKATMPIAELAAKVPWADAVPAGLVRFIGIAELAAGVGLILPALTRVLPRLTPLAAAGLAMIMVFAIGFHVQRNEFQALPFNLVLGALAAFVAWGRFRKAPIAPRAAA
jgi:hypothetical protein